ncbi:MAG: immunoglobulin domain-containing protein [Phycisphaerae bacterium]
MRIAVHVVRTLALIPLLGPPLAAAQTIVYAEDFETGAPGWTIDNQWGSGKGMWHISSACQAAEPGHSAASVMFFGNDSTCEIEPPVQAVGGRIVSPLITIPSTAGCVSLSLRYWIQTEPDPGFDQLRVQIEPIGQTPWLAASNKANGGVPMRDPSFIWEQIAIDLNAAAGRQIQIAITFDTYDDYSNDDVAIYLDDLVITQDTSPPAAPVITAQPADVTTPCGSPAVFSVSVDTAQPVWCQWRHNGVAIDEFPNYSGQFDAALTVTTPHGPDAGLYDVLVYYACGVVISTPARLTVTAIPCAGDLDQDCIVSESDLGILLGAWQAGAGGDLDGDGQTSEADLGILLGNWQNRCPP